MTGTASADRDSAASEDGETRFLLHEDVLTVIGSGETGNYTLVEPARKSGKEQKGHRLIVCVLFCQKFVGIFGYFMKNVE